MSDDQMLAQHQRTYSGFVKGTAICVAVTVLTLILMALFLL